VAANAVTDFFRYLAFMPDAGPAWKPGDFDFDRDPQRETVMEGLYASSNPDLRAYQEAGGKLLMVQGWADSGTPFPLRTIDYYQTVERAMGGAEPTRAFARLFMVPGSDHCGGGDGASSADYLASLEAWVEQGQAPDLIKAAHVEPVGDAADFLREPADPTRVKFTRPLYPYPAWAKYKGSGDPNDYRSFKAAGPGK
jgi:feruloyl esterase